MKFSIPTKKLIDLVTIAQKGISTKAINPLLSCFYIKASNNAIEIQSTDYIIVISCIVAANVEEEGTIIIPGKQFTEIIRRLPSEQVTVQTIPNQNNLIEITSSNSAFNLINMQSEDYPISSKIISNNQLEIKADLFVEGINQTQFACANKTDLPIYNSILIEINNRELNFVATNTHRLAVKKYNIETDENNVKLLIPSDFLKEVAKILTDKFGESIIISWNNKQVAFSIDDIYLETRLVEGNFPDYSRAIPSNFKINTSFNRKDMLESLKRASLMAKDDKYINLNFKDNEIVIKAQNQEYGTFSDVVICEQENEEINISFNYRYITDYLEEVDDDSINFSMNLSSSPARIQSPKHENYTYILTPVRNQY